MAPCAGPCTSEGSSLGLLQPCLFLQFKEFWGPKGKAYFSPGTHSEHLARIREFPAQLASQGLFPRSILPGADLPAGVCPWAWGSWVGGWVGRTQGRMECGCARAPAVQGKTRLGEWSALPRSPHSVAELKPENWPPGHYEATTS